MYALANIIIDQFGDANASKRVTFPTKPEADAKAYKSSLSWLPSEDREVFEERAAIIEFEGGLDREEAERKAILNLVRRRHETK
jgi:hypothetical protein